MLIIKKDGYAFEICFLVNVVSYYIQCPKVVNTDFFVKTFIRLQNHSCNDKKNNKKLNIQYKEVFREVKTASFFLRVCKLFYRCKKYINYPTSHSTDTLKT